MKSFEQDRLLREILDDGEGTDFHGQSLAHGLAFLQRRRRRNRLARMGVGVVGSVLLAFALAFHQATKHSGTPPLTALVAETPKVEIITDEQLFALFPNRAVALIGSPGQQELVFLDHGEASEQP